MATADRPTTEEVEAAKAEYLDLSMKFTERGRGSWRGVDRANPAAPGTTYSTYECVERPSMTNDELVPLSRAQDRYADLLWRYNGGSFRARGAQ